MPARLELNGEEIARRVANGETYGEIGKDYGCTRHTVMYWAKKFGVRSHHKPASIPVCIDGEWMSLTHAARSHGLSPNTVLYRYRAGDRGRDLVRKPNYTYPPSYFDYGLSIADWRTISDYGNKHGASRAAKKFSIRQSAARAAMEWQEHRLA